MAKVTMVSGRVYSLFGKNGATMEEVQSSGLPLGQVVSYGDQANPRTEYVVVEVEGGPYGQRCINREHYGASTVSITSIEGPGGWQKVDEIASADEIARLHEAHILMVYDRTVEQIAQQQERDNAVEKGKPLIPHWATHAIVAELHEDQSDLHTDYHASKTTRCVLLAFSSHDKDRFDEMRKAAARFDETAHLGPGKDRHTVYVVFADNAQGNARYYHKGERSHFHDEWGSGKTFLTRAEAEQYISEHPDPDPVRIDETLVRFHWEIASTSVEHREKYSMGRGYYLHAGSSYSGWRVRKQVVGDSIAALLGRGHVVEGLLTAAPQDTPAPVTFAGVIMTQNEERNGVELRFAEKPSAEIREQLKASGFRWSRPQGLWYAKRSEKTLNVARALIN